MPKHRCTRHSRCGQQWCGDEQPRPPCAQLQCDPTIWPLGRKAVAEVNRARPPRAQRQCTRANQPPKANPACKQRQMGTHAIDAQPAWAVAVHQ
mmetsp:Transcript_64778/g.208623  ORF Transcript_64778/g.208623 Transcript_64778/m.208623 type:complete len:94 (+) Transcript_64778:130-411(+)